MRIDPVKNEYNKYLKRLRNRARLKVITPAEEIVLKREEYFLERKELGEPPTLNGCVQALGFASFEEAKSKLNDDVIGREILIAITKLREYYEIGATASNKPIGCIFMLKVLGMRENERTEETKDLISEALEKAFKPKPIKVDLPTPQEISKTKTGGKSK